MSTKENRIYGGQTWQAHLNQVTGINALMKMNKLAPLRS